MLSEGLSAEIGDVILKMCSSLGLIGTFTRTIHDFDLPWIFICLPIILLASILLLKITELSEDLSIRVIIIGAITGVSLGFLATVSDDHRTSLLYRKQYDVTEKYHALKIITQKFEWLHFVTIVASLATLVQSVHVYFFKSSTLILAVITAFFSALLLDILFLLLYVDLEYYVFDFDDHYVPVCVLTLFIFLLLMSLLSRDQAASLFLWFAGYLCILYWQSVHQGSLYLDWTRATVALPGSIFAVIFLFHHTEIDMIEFRTTTTEMIPAMTCRETEKIDQLDSRIQEPLHRQLTYGHSIHWLLLTFAIERISLLFMYIHQQQHTDSHSDCILCCVLIMVFIYIMSPLFDGTMTSRVCATFAVQVLYVSIAAPMNCLHNSMFLELLMACSALFVFKNALATKPLFLKKKRLALERQERMKVSQD